MIEKLDAAIKAVCPINGVSIGHKNDKRTWKIDFKDEATAEQRAAADAVVAATDAQTFGEPDYAQRRRDEYVRRGVTMEAIMEGVIEYLGNRPEKLMALMVIRDEVRAQIPKDTP